MTLSNCQVADSVCGFDIDVEVLNQRFSLLVDDFVIAEETVRLSPNENVLGYCQVVHHVEFLMNDGNACFLSFFDVLEVNRLTEKTIFPSVIRVDSRHYLYES